MKSWINESHDNQVILDQRFKKIEAQPLGLKINLYEYQKTMVQAMIELETAREIVNRDGKTTYTAGVLSDPVGSGKTIVILSFIMMYRDALNMPDIVTDINEESIIRRTFTHVLKPNLIIVGRTVLSQWRLAIKNFTNLRAIEVSDIHDLEILVKLIENHRDRLNKYDVVLIKNGLLSRNVTVGQDSFIRVNENHNNSLFGVLSKFRNITWNRVIIDDFDSIGLPPNIININGLFTWFISSTERKKTSIQRNRVRLDADTFHTNAGFVYKQILLNPILFKVLNLRNHKDYITETCQIITPRFYLYKCFDPHARQLKIMRLLDQPNSDRIIEMINAGAWNDAAEEVGISTPSVSDIFKRVLGRHFEAYKTAVAVLDHIKQIRELDLLPASQIPSDPENVEHTYNKKKLLSFTFPKYRYPGMSELLDNAELEYSAIKRDNGIAIDRVKSNVQIGECPICMSDFNELEDSNAICVILTCCGIVMCNICMLRAVFKYGIKSGRCTHCRQNITIDKILSIDKNNSLDSIMLDTSIIRPAPEVEKKAPTKNTKTEQLDKMDVILGIIMGDSCVNKIRREVTVAVSNLMMGSNPGSAELPKYNKTLVFANYDSSLNKLVDKLNASNGIKYWQLMGTRGQIDKTVEEFRAYTDGPSVLLINSMQHCAGLNLQFATDLVFIHKIEDAGIEAQVLGRGQRLGRTTALRVHYVLYDNEYESMKGRIKIK